MSEQLKAVILRGIPLNLHTRAKVQAALEHTTLNDLILKALEQYLNKKNRKGG